MGFFDTISDTVSKAKHGASSFIDTGRDKLGDTISFGSRIARSSASTISNEWDDTKDFVKRTKKKVTSTVSNEWDDAKDFVKKAKKKVASTVSNEWDDTKDLAKKVKKKVTSTVSNEWDDAKDFVKKTKKKITSTASNEWDRFKSGTKFVKDRAIDWVKNNSELDPPTINIQSADRRDRQLRQNLQRFWKTPLGDRISQPPVTEGPWTKLPTYGQEQKKIQKFYTESFSEQLSDLPPYVGVQGYTAKVRIPRPFSGFLPGDTDLSVTGGSYEDSAYISEEKTRIAARSFSLFDLSAKKDLITSGNNLEISWGPKKASTGYAAEFRHGEDIDGDGYKEYGIGVDGVLPYGLNAGFRVEPDYWRVKATPVANTVKRVSQGLWNHLVG
ncbi:MAG: hypothetical protein KME17_00700 [Cyanosarcina radialis HA8281-LM2]|jgi:hypothetical protein|nr:hypothetical protein [Cyanosarcina radialis HA8281-LM2]